MYRKIAVISAVLLLSTAISANTLQEEKDFGTLAESMRAKGKPLVLAFDAEHCHYCARLQADHLDPMLISGEYRHVLIRSIDLDGGYDITDFDGQTIDASEFSKRYKVRLTPTLLFLDAEGKEIAKRILGYNTPELYGAYLDRAIDEATTHMNQIHPASMEVKKRTATVKAPEHGAQPTEEAAQTIEQTVGTITAAE